MNDEKQPIENLIEGIDYNTKLAKVTLQGVMDRPGVAAEIFSSLGQQGLNVELISQCLVGHGRADISIGVLEANIDNVCEVLERTKDRFGAQKIVVDKECALITIYGSMLSGTPGVAGEIFNKLSERHINIEMISASLSSMSVVVKKEKVMDALGAIRVEFGV